MTLNIFVTQGGILALLLPRKSGEMRSCIQGWVKALEDGRKTKFIYRKLPEVEMPSSGTALCYKSQMAKIIERWLLFKLIGREFTPLSKPFKTKQLAEKARLRKITEFQVCPKFRCRPSGM